MTGDFSSLDEKPANVAASGSVVDGTVVEAEKSDAAMVTDRWHKRRGADLAAKWGEGDADNIIDAHTACFEPFPTAVDECKDKVRHRWYQDLISSPDFRAMHVSTSGSVSMAEIAAFQLNLRYKKYLAGLTDEEREGIEQSEPEDEEVRDGIKRIVSVGEAVSDAQTEVNQAGDMASSFGCGSHNGAGGDLDPAAILASYEGIRNNEVLRAIVENAGRLINVAKSMQKKKPTHGMDDVVGVELSDGIGRMLPSEMMLLGSPAELDLMRRLQEKQVLCRKYSGKQGLGRGPIMVLVDESGSMEGDRIVQAKGFALAMAWLARYQRRYCCLVGWSSRSQVRELVVKPGGQSSKELMDWCSFFWDGGTSPPLPSVPRLFEETGAPKGKTDVIWITDGSCRLGNHDVVQFNKWREENEVKVWTIGIEMDATSFYQISDVVTKVTEFHQDQAIVADLLSL